MESKHRQESFPLEHSCLNPDLVYSLLSLTTTDALGDEIPYFAIWQKSAYKPLCHARLISNVDDIMRKAQEHDSPLKSTRDKAKVKKKRGSSVPKTRDNSGRKRQRTKKVPEGTVRLDTTVLHTKENTTQLSSFDPLLSSFDPEPKIYSTILQVGEAETQSRDIRTPTERATIERGECATIERGERAKKQLFISFPAIWKAWMDLVFCSTNGEEGGRYLERTHRSFTPDAKALWLPDALNALKEGNLLTDTVMNNVAFLFMQARPTTSPLHLFILSSQGFLPRAPSFQSFYEKLVPQTKLSVFAFIINWPLKLHWTVAVLYCPSGDNVPYLLHFDSLYSSVDDVITEEGVYERLCTIPGWSACFPHISSSKIRLYPLPEQNQYSNDCGVLVLMWLQYLLFSAHAFIALDALPHTRVPKYGFTADDCSAFRLDLASLLSSGTCDILCASDNPNKMVSVAPLPVVAKSLNPMLSGSSGGNKPKYHHYFMPTKKKPVSLFKPVTKKVSPFRPSRPDGRDFPCLAPKPCTAPVQIRRELYIPCQIPTP